LEGGAVDLGLFTAVLLLLSPHQLAANFHPSESSWLSGDIAVLASRLAAPVITGEIFGNKRDQII
jgi:hypothetical protein